MESEYRPLSMLDVLYWDKVSRKMPRNEVEQLQRLLQRRALDCGCEEGVPAVISGLTDRFVDEERDEMRKQMAEYVRRQGIMEQQRIEATDEQIIDAIKKTLPDFGSDWDWGGVYRILVDYCNHLGFSATKTKFVERFARMCIYPKDSVVQVERSAPPALYQNDFCGHPFSYQAIQKGVDAYWPGSYQDWKTSDITTNDFIARRNIAATFLRNLIRATEGQSLY